MGIFKVATDRPSAFTADLLRDYSLEITAKDEPVLAQARVLLPAETVVSVTYLPGETMEARISAAAEVRRLGLTPMPHISARRIPFSDDLQRFLASLSAKAAVDRVFIVAGDCDEPQGPFEDALAVIRGGRLKDHGVRMVGIGGYPEGHPRIPQDKLWRAMADKTAALAEMGLECEIITQFSFDADPVLHWLAQLRASGVQAPVRIGLPGPASVGTLLRFAMRCGVGVSSKVMTKYGASIGRALSPAGPDKLTQSLIEQLSPAVHGEVRAHFYPFGGVVRTAEWARDYAAQDQTQQVK